LTLEAIRSAHHHKAVIVNHLKVEGLTRSAGRRVDGIRARDALLGETIDTRARVVVNASGPWTAEILALDPAHRAPGPSFVRSVHILAPLEKFPVSEGIAFRVKGEGQWMFVLPLEGFALLGPYETEHRGLPDQVCAEREDVDQILRATAQCFSGVRLERGDLVSTYAALRLADAERRSMRQDALTHEHEVRVSPAGLVTAPMGDLTNHRTSAQHLVSHLEKALAREFGVHASYPSRSVKVPSVRSEGDGKALTPKQQKVLESLSPGTREHLTRTYGANVTNILDYAVADNKLCSPIIDRFPYIWAEIPHAVEQEMASTVGDVMMRRLDLFHEMPDGAVVAAREIARYMARFLDWLGSDIEQEVMNYSEAVRLNRESLKS
jgi:glycerol-3-phosphate dehydrogenase